MRKSLKSIKERRAKSLTLYVAFSITFVVLYTIAEFVCSIITGVTHEELTQHVYLFFAGEVATSGLIKIFKIRGNQ